LEVPFEIYTPGDMENLLIIKGVDAQDETSCGLISQ
jgi:hypothetical protein